MKNTNATSPEGYSIIAAVLMVGFLLILTTSTLNLVLQEMQDGRGRQWYLSAYAGAEWALELALLDMKVQGYWYDDDSFIDKEILWSWPKYPKISYEFNSRVETFNGSIAPLGIDIIPLFSSWSWWLVPTTEIIFNIESGDILWNIITQTSWVSGTGGFTQAKLIGEKTLDASWNFWFSPLTPISSILSWEDYLILQNLSNSPSSYTLTWNPWFTLPRAEIISSAKVWKYKQNLKTTVDNTEFLWILRYSVYSWD
jgi:hypothetical protein